MALARTLHRSSMRHLDEQEVGEHGREGDNDFSMEQGVPTDAIGLDHEVDSEADRHDPQDEAKAEDADEPDGEQECLDT